MNVLVAISHLCITFKSSINFVIYCGKDEKFRRHFVRYLTFGHFSLSSDEGIKSYGNRGTCLTQSLNFLGLEAI